MVLYWYKGQQRTWIYPKIKISGIRINTKNGVETQEMNTAPTVSSSTKKQLLLLPRTPSSIPSHHRDIMQHHHIVPFLESICTPTVYLPTMKPICKSCARKSGRVTSTMSRSCENRLITLPNGVTSGVTSIWIQIEIRNEISITQNDDVLVTMMRMAEMVQNHTIECVGGCVKQTLEKGVMQVCWWSGCENSENNTANWSDEEGAQTPRHIG